LLLGTRLIVLEPHGDQPLKSNVILDMPLPQSDEKISVRKRSREFQELSEFVKRRAYGAYSHPHEDQPVQETHGRGASL
jgi:hypothetical protein